MKKLLLLATCCLLVYCTPKNQQESKPNVSTENSSEVKEPLSFMDAHVVAYKKEDALYFYVIETQKTIPFNEETEKVCHYAFDVDGHTMFYTIEKNEKLFLKKAIFSADGIQVYEIMNLNIPKEEMESTMKYRNGKLIIPSDFSWDAYSFSKYHIYTIADNKLTSTDDYSVANELLGKEGEFLENYDNFVIRNEQLYYLNNGKEVCLTNQLNLKEEDENYAVEKIIFGIPMISPNGTKIAFEVVNSFGDLPHGPLCIADVDGKNQQILTDDGVAEDYKPKWIDNRLVFINRGTGDESNVLLITDAKSNVPSNLLEDVMSFDLKQPAK